ncbi:uncharacterized protein LOC113772203 [Coffea eugenioides]|uniref:uncharacterized protein LOC113772203 n=1 Tax=Coffea eugenioides TaxID=49369 RepID=UPI000F6121A8|nr:uncharacterized protein LOC113772203 [Coffea eugenioides]
MGRRKERRLAALSAAGRRLKLDLIAEPSGDLGGSSVQKEVGGDDNTKNHAGLPNSPSSSGKRAENPLVLLGQYSDDELDDGSSGEQNKAEDSCARGVDDQEKLAAGRASEDFGVKEGNGSAGDKLGQLAVENGPVLMDSLENLEGVIAGIHATGTDVLHDAHGLTEQVTAATTSDTQVVGDVSSGWKVVLHEESNQYYYWNIATGETSWEVPGVLAQATEPKGNASEQKEKDVSEVKNHNLKTIEGNIDVPITNTLDEGYVRDTLDDKKQDHGGDALDDIRTLRGTNVSPGQSDNVFPTDGNATSIQLLKPGGRDETGTDFPSLLMKQSENLLGQLNTVKGLKGYFKGIDHITKCILEVEMRLSDIKSLACHGSLLLPFWEHSERRLLELEAVIYNIVQELKSERVHEVDTTSILPESIGEDIKANSSEEKAVDVASDDFGASESAGITEFQKNNPELDNGGATGSENVPSDPSLIERLVNAGGKVEARHAVHQELTPKALLHTGEEVDMDVDMEVEDVDPSNNLIVSVPSEQHNDQTLPADLQSSVPLELCSIPPPPDEDWIPPPPPDNEPFPPPPPDEPPEISGPQPSDLVSTESFPYVEPYNLYPSSNFQYYAQGNTNISASNMYAPTDGCQPTVSQPPLYFEALSDTYAPATLAVNPIEPGLYYGLQDGITQPVSLESSVFHGDSVQNSISDPTGSLEVQAAVGSASLLKGDIDVPAISVDAKKASLEPSSSEVTLAPATISELEGASEPLVPATTSSITASTTAPKARSKVQRNKKRTVAVVSSLRSNKKVSSLVDKWKAAKEELQEDEKEPENAYEILEKKRQRQIKEWHAQQIASGEAQENANFQPLGGDWRERVKRKRAQLAKESVQTPKDDVFEGNQQPDLGELSKGLPRGWQAYWDVSSKQVYYGNTLTTETTWVRPTT